MAASDPTTLNQLNGPAATGVRQSTNTSAKSATVAEEFEAVFLQNMIDAMFRTLEGGGTFGDSNASETWRGMLSEQYASAIVNAGGIGIADAVQRELLAVQEGNQE